MLEKLARIAEEAGRIAAGALRHRLQDAGRRCPAIRSATSTSRSTPSCASELGALDPEAGWLSEETLDDSDRIERPRLWVVDPIDGTRDYLRDRPGWCVSVALVEDRVPVLGVLGGADARRAVDRGARRGQPAQRRSRSGSARAPSWPARGCPPTSCPTVDRDLVAVAKPNSIALRIALVAAGEADLRGDPANGASNGTSPPPP